MIKYICKNVTYAEEQYKVNASFILEKANNQGNVVDTSRYRKKRKNDDNQR